MMKRHPTILGFCFWSMAAPLVAEAWAPRLPQAELSTRQRLGRTALQVSLAPEEFSSASARSTPSFPVGSTVELIDPVTGCQVILLGCFHGSQSSALDVTTCLEQPLLVDLENDRSQQQVVALELCASRFDDLRKDVLLQREQAAGLRSKKTVPWMIRFIHMVQKTIEKRGLSTGVAAALLGGVSGIQTSMSGLQPGLEFQTALEYVLDHPDGQKQQQQIVLADQNVDETLAKVGQVPGVAVQLWKNFLTKGSWKETFGKEATALARAVGLADTACETKVTLGGFVTRSSYAIRDMARMMIPPILILQGFLISANAVVEWLQQQSPEWIDATATAAVAAPALDDTGALVALASLVSNYGVLLVGYLSVALPAVRVILRERDTVLTQGIQQACQLATCNGSQPGRVVAVLGLLHVNGVAEQMMMTQPPQSESA